MNYLVWRGIDSRELKSLVVCELPPITKPPMRVVETIIDGVDGSKIEELGFSSYDKALVIGLKQNADVNEILDYFTGSGEVVFSNEPDKYYKATIINQVDYARLVRFKVATVVFRVQPYKYEYEEEPTVASAETIKDNVLVINDGNCSSKPVIEIRGSGAVEMIVNGNKMFSYTFPEGEDVVIIDSEKQDAYFGSNLKNRNMSGEFPALDVGINTITWEGNVTSLSITSKSRWL